MKLLPYLRLFRLSESFLISGTSSMSLIMLGISSFQDILLLFGTILAASFGVFAWNDSLDIKEDTIAHPERPIIKGEVTIRNARINGTIFLLISLILGAILVLTIAMIGIANIGLAIGVAIVGIWLCFSCGIVYCIKINQSNRCCPRHIT